MPRNGTHTRPKPLDFESTNTHKTDVLYVHEIIVHRRFCSIESCAFIPRDVDTERICPVPSLPSSSSFSSSPHHPTPATLSHCIFYFSFHSISNERNFSFDRSEVVFSFFFFFQNVCDVTKQKQKRKKSRIETLSSLVLVGNINVKSLATSLYVFFPTRRKNFFFPFFFLFFTMLI